MQTISYEESGKKYVEILLEDRGEILVWKQNQAAYIIHVYWSDSGKSFELTCNCPSFRVCHHRKHAAKDFKWSRKFEPQSEWARVNEAYLVNYLDNLKLKREGKWW